MHPAALYRAASVGAPASYPLLLAAWLATATCRPAYGQETQADSVTARPDTGAIYSREEILVSVTRIQANFLRLPYAVNVLGVEALREGERGVSLEEALRSLPGVFVQNRRNSALGDRIVIRGVGARSQFGVRGVKVLLDGIPLTLPDGQAVLSNLDIPTVGRLEVIRGPSSALYGNASGGVISLTTEAPPTFPFTANTRMLGGSHGVVEARSRASGRIGSVGYGASFSRLETDGFRENAHAEEYRGNFVAQSALSSSAKLSGVLNLFHTPFAQNPSSLAREDARKRPRLARSFVVAQGAGKSTTQGQGGLALDLELRHIGQLRTSAWGLWRDLFNPIPGRIIDIHRLAGGIRTEYRGATRVAGRSLRWTGGVDVGVQRDRRRENKNLGLAAGEKRAKVGDSLLDQRENVLGIGPFLQLEAALTPQLTLTVAGRVDRYRFNAVDFRLEDGDDTGDRTLSHVSPMVGLSYAATPGISVYGNFSTAFQTPTTSELSNRPDGSGGFNPSLGPERIASFELGAKGILPGPRVRFDLTFYRAFIRDALIPFQSQSEEVFFRNAGRADRTGVEAAASWRPVRRLEAQLAYAFQRFRFDEFVTDDGDFSGNREPGVPDHTLFLSLIHHASGGLRSEVDFRWTDAFPVNDANTATNWSSRVVDLRFSLERPPSGFPLRPFLGIDNLFAERYNGSVVPNAFGSRFYEPAPGIEVYGGLSWDLGRD